MDAYTTINDMQEISQNTSYLLSSTYTGIGEIMGMGYRMQTVKLQLMMS